MCFCFVLTYIDIRGSVQPGQSTCDLSYQLYDIIQVTTSNSQCGRTIGEWAIEDVILLQGCQDTAVDIVYGCS